MICEKCSKEYDEALGACPHCSAKTAEADGKKPVKPKTEITPPAIKPQPPQSVKKKPGQSEKQKKSEKLAMRAVVSLMCILAVAMAAITAVGSMTDIFKKKDDVKAVALMLTPEEKTELEAQLLKLWPLSENGFDSDKMGAKELLSLIRPYSTNGLYASFGYEAAVQSMQKDPALRFCDANGEYAYYKISQDRIDSIISQFDLNVDHTVNYKDIYYYDSYYYFAPGIIALQEYDVTAAITGSKRIQDGRYYVTCTLSEENSTQSKDIYVIASKEKKDETYWKIHSISLTPVFDELGIMIKDSADENKFDYDMKTEIIEAKADDGTLYGRYVLEYPVFYGKTSAETEANRFYQSVLTVYRQQAENAQADYKSFIKKNGKKETLPLEVHYTSEVTYAEDDYIGVTCEISESVPMYKEEIIADTVIGAATEQEKAQLASKTMECYIFDTQTGAYVTKDAVIGKDYRKISELLYRIYNGYDYSSVIGETTAPVYEEIPRDTEGLGEKIYNSASTLSSEGYMFCYVNEEGYREDVVIPFGTSGIFTE